MKLMNITGVKTAVNKWLTMYNIDKINSKNIDMKRAQSVDDILDRCEDGHGIKMSGEEFLREIKTW